MEGWDRRLSEFVYAFARADNADEFRLVIAQGIGDVVPNDLAAYTEVDLVSHRVTAVADHDVPDFQEILTELGRLAHQHPLITHPHAGARAISDYLTVRQFHALALYQDVYRRLGAEDQIAISLPAAASAVRIGLALNRSRRGFEGTARETLNTLYPLLARGHGRVLALARARELLAQLNEANPERVGVVVLDRDGGFEFASELARGWLHTYFPHGPAGRLPAPVSDWLEAGADSAESLTIAGEAGSLVIRVLPAGAGESRLLELDERRTRSPAALLTPREHQILKLLAIGESNQQVARSLGVSQRTVESHLRSIFRKLGVTNRTAAVAGLADDPLAL